MPPGRKGMGGRMAHYRDHQHIVMAERRLQVGEMMRLGMTYPEMAEKLNVSIGTIASDASEVLINWQRQQNGSIEQYVEEQLVHLDMAIHALMPKVLAGDERAINTMISIYARKSKLKGLDQPDLVIPWEHLSREQMQRIADGEDPRRVVYGK